MLSFCEKIRKNACRLIIILYLCSANTKYEIKMSNLIKPEGYKALLDMRQTEMGIKMIKEFFQQNLALQPLHQSAVLRFRVADDDVVVGDEEHVAHLPLGGK